jgi:hypothetical protein
MPTTDPPVADSPRVGNAAKSGVRTEYVVLEMVDDDGWREAARITTSSSIAAIREHLKKRPAGERTDASLVAVPARSWQPVRQETKTVTTTSLEPIT